MKEQENTLLYGPVRAELVRFALPVILSMLATQLYTVADTMVIGLRLDAAALAAVSNASTVLMIFLFVSGGMELGGGLLLAAKRPTATREELCAMTYNLLLIDGAIGLLMMALGYGGIEQFLRWINTPAEILPEAARYAWFYLPGLPCLMLYDLAKQIVIGSGDSKTPLYAVLFTSVLNVGLDIVLVGPFGVAGAAAATAFSQLVGLVVMLAHLRRTLLTEPFRPGMLRPALLWDIFRLSAPNAVQQASGPVVNLVKQGLLGTLGVAAIAGFSCASKLSTLLLMPVFGVAQSLVFFIAQNTAAGQPGRVTESLREARRLVLLYAALVVGGCVLFARPMLGLFTEDAGAVAFGALMLSRDALAYPFTCLRHMQEARLRGAQKMGLYLISNLGVVALNLAACVVLVPRVGFSGFYLSSYISAPLGLLTAAALVRLSQKSPAPAPESI